MSFWWLTNWMAAAGRQCWDCGEDFLVVQRLPGETLRRLASRLEETGTTKDAARRGRPRSIRSAENIAALADDVMEAPWTSDRRRAKRMGISRRSLHRMFIQDLKMCRYKVQMVHQLSAADRQSRLTHAIAALAEDVMEAPWTSNRRRVT
ncbi:uncharacterized protein LOC131805873 [Musca domestica]|uniref:Uncharacterized protein LOC131805873 n=1 Tax=Musca domestica TaxID=7370 RepID=A0ABM3VIY4_MUSDO|nr:uncharacterized protein LOC131805873 [Musca domestica]